jgi:soluble lytic murein transglycosylase-like protein
VLVAASVTILVVVGVVWPRVQPDDGPVDRSIDVYTVQLGDTISSVAQLHGTTKEAIEEANDLTERSSIEPGSQIEVPHPATDESQLPTFLADDPTLMALRPTFATAAEEHDVPVALLESLAWQESAWDNDRIGVGGTVGISQLNESTVDFINDELVVGPALDPTVTADNITLMAAYLDHLLSETDGSWAATVAAYRLGLSASRAEAWDADTQGYITTVVGGTPDFEAS